MACLFPKTAAGCGFQTNSATEITRSQLVVKDRMQRQAGSRATAADHKMRQDKLLELRQLQIRRNPLPRLALPLLHPQIFGILPTHSPLLENPQPVDGEDEGRPPQEKRPRALAPRSVLRRCPEVLGAGLAP